MEGGKLFSSWPTVTRQGWQVACVYGCVYGHSEHCFLALKKQLLGWMLAWVDGKSITTLHDTDIQIDDFMDRHIDGFSSHSKIFLISTAD